MSEEVKKENKYNKRRWRVPHKRAKGYAEERKARVHKWGPKEGKELTDYEAGVRSGYLQCQTDHAALYNYKKEMSAKDAAKAAKEAEKAAKIAEKLEKKEAKK